MSNPVSNAEVEDVLSSIRRLVSEDKRPLQASRPAPAPASDRLVLTPALRVAEPEPVKESAKTPYTSRVAEDAYDDEDMDFASDDDEDMTAVVDRSHDYTTDPYDFADEDDDDAGEPALRHADADEKWQLDENDDASDEASDDDEAFEASTAGHEPDRHDDARESGQGSKASALSAKIAALESAIGKIPDRWEPDAPGADEYSGTDAPAMAWEDDVHRDATGARMAAPDALEEDEEDVAIFARDPAPSAAAAEADDDSDAFPFSGDDQLIDEEALRDLVSEIVRAELQGALGERITRNVRKLVRREIHRALTAQELE